MKVLPYNTLDSLNRRVMNIQKLLKSSNHNPAKIEKTFAKGTIKSSTDSYSSISRKICGVIEVISGHNTVLNKESGYDRIYFVSRHIPNQKGTDTYFNKDGIRFAKCVSKHDNSAPSNKKEVSYYLYDSHGVKPRECSFDEFRNEVNKHENL